MTLLDFYDEIDSYDDKLHRFLKKEADRVVSYAPSLVIQYTLPNDLIYDNVKFATQYDDGFYDKIHKKESVELMDYVKLMLYNGNTLEGFVYYPTDLLDISPEDRDDWLMDWEEQTIN